MPSAPLTPEQRFSDRVENYVRHRPSYPEQVIDLLWREAGLRAGSVVADVGSGTGIFTKLLLRAGCVVFGVEPNREMRRAAERLLAGEPLFHSIDGSAEATTLEDHCADLLVAAQAFHWFRRPEARAEFSRILRPQGRVALIWNERRPDATPFLSDYEQLLRTFGTDYAQVRHENIGKPELGEFFVDGAYTTHSMPNEQSFDHEGLRGRLLSSSYAPAEGRPGHKPMIEELSRIFERHQTGGRVSFTYDTRVYIGR